MEKNDQRNNLDSSEKNICLPVYCSYLCAIALPIIALIGVIVAYVYRNDVEEWLKTHFSYQIRTFWWSLLFICIIWLTAFIFIGYALLVVYLIWNIARAISGIKYLNKGQSIDFASLEFIAKES